MKLLSYILLSASWSPSSWRTKNVVQIPTYPNTRSLERVEKNLKNFPPLIFAGECRNLQQELADAGDGKRFILTAGDCAESFNDFSIQNVMNQYRIILQMTLILMYGINKPIVKIGRLAGQFAKPRSDLFETQGDLTLNSYQGDIINSYKFSKISRRPNPYNMIKAYHQSCQTLNLLRALSSGGYASIERIHNWNLDFVKDYEVNLKYKNLATSVQDCLNFLGSLDLKDEDVLKKAQIYTGHEGLLLPYEEALVRKDSTTSLYYDCSAHFLWVGERTRQLDGSHVEFFKGINNPIGIKISGNCDSDELVQLLNILNPDNKKGKITIITRMGSVIDTKLPQLIDKVINANKNVVWVCDPMHGNTKKLQNGLKTRFMYDIKKELELFFQIHKSKGTIPAGIHLELTGSDVTECVGSDFLLNESKNMKENYKSLCDPRLNAAQSLELAFWISDFYKNSLVR